MSENCNHHHDVSNISTFAACGTKPFEGAGKFARTVEPKIDFIYPKVTFPSNKLYEEWGEQKIREMVFYHHNLLRKSALGNLFPAEEEDFIYATQKTADFFVEALGGGKVYTSVHGHPALRGRHLHISIDEQARDIWLMMYKKTIKDLNMPHEHIQEFWTWIEALSIRMINRRTSVMDIQRHSYEEIWNK